MKFIERFKGAIQAFRAPVQAGFIEPTPLTGPRISTQVRNDNRGNQFITYGEQVNRSWELWRARAQYGSEIYREVVKYRSGWIAGNGVDISVEGDKEQEFLESFVKYNQLDGAYLTRLVRGSEIEGKSLLILVPVTTPEGLQIEVRYVRWIKIKYLVEVEEDNEEKITKVCFKDSHGKEIELSPDQFVYVILDHDGFDLNKPTPPLAGVLTNMVNMGKALADWRDYNHNWGVLGIHYNVADIQAGEELTRVIENKTSHQLGDSLAFPGTAYFPEPSGAGTNSIKQEIDLQAKIISGASGVPIHLLGWASEMSNRATAEEMMESVQAHTAEPRDIWQSAIVELVAKAMAIHSNITGQELDSSTLDAKLTQVTRHQLRELIDVWVPLAEGGYIPQDEVRRRIPGIDVQTIHEQLEAETLLKPNLLEGQVDEIG